VVALVVAAKNLFKTTFLTFGSPGKVSAVAEQLTPPTEVAGEVRIATAFSLLALAKIHNAQVTGSAAAELCAGVVRLFL